MKVRRLVLTGAAALALVFASGAMAFAASDTTAADAAPAQMSATQRDALQDAAAESLETAIANLVEDETLTEEEAETILEALEAVSETTEQSETAGGPFADLDEDQITALLAETATLTEEAIAELDDGEKLTEEELQAIRETAVENLVADETLTEDEAEAILAAQEDPEDSTTGTTMTDPFADLSDEQQSALTEEFLAVFETALDELVSDETITEEMAESVLAMYSGTEQTCPGQMMQQGQMTQNQTGQGQMMQQGQQSQMMQPQQNQGQPMMRLFMNGGR